jgi:membrane dipeptidase
MTSNFYLPIKPIAAIVASVALAACTHTPAERAEIAHARALVLDAHADIVIPSTSKAYLAEGGASKVSAEKLRAGGVDAVVMSVAVGPGPRTPAGDLAARAEADEKLGAVQAMLAAAPDEMMLARSVAEIERARRAGKIAVLVSFQNARAMQGQVSGVDAFYQQGVRIFALNHIGHNDFSDSSRPNYNGDTASYEVTEEHGGLSTLGSAVVDRVNDLGAVMDVSQMSKAATLQTIARSRAPVIASHSNVQAITNVTRNLSDEEIDRIGETGGVIHVAAFGAYLVDLSQQSTLDEIVRVRLKHGLPEAYAYPYELYWELDGAAAKTAFLSEMRGVIGPGSVADMLDHIDYIAARIGVDHVGIGNDFNHGSGIEGYADASEARAITRGLAERGYSVSDIEKIWGGNFMRVFAAAEQAAVPALAE